MNLPLIGHLAVWSTLLPAVVGMWRYRNLDSPMKLFAFFCVIGVLNVLLEIALSRMNMNNHFLSDAYWLIAVPFLGLVYYRSVTSSTVRILLGICTVTFVSVWLVQESFFAEPGKLNSILAMITAIFLVMMSIATMNALVKSTVSHLTGEPMFWVLTGTMVYYAGSFAVMGLGSNLLDVSASLFKAAWYVNWVLIVVSMLMYAKGFLCKSQA